MPSRVMRLRRDGACASCATAVPIGSDAFWDAEAKTITCLPCHEAPREAAAPASAPLDPIVRGEAGASAAREYERRRQNHERRMRERHPRIGGVILALSDEPQHQVAWRKGELGEVAVAGSLEARIADGPAVLLHDRRKPGGGNIDHIAVAPTGVYVIDAKAIEGKVRVQAPIFGKPKLLVNGRDRTKLIDGLDRQVTAVRDALPEPGLAVHGVLCFTKADLPLLGTLRMRSHLLLYRKALAKRLNADGPLGPGDIERIARTLAAGFPPA